MKGKQEEMEVGSKAFIDPEEDEIFFYEITEKEAVAKGSLKNESCASEENNVSEDNLNKNSCPLIDVEKVNEDLCSSAFKQCVDVEKLLDLECSTVRSAIVAVSPLTDQESKVESSLMEGSADANEKGRAEHPHEEHVKQGSLQPPSISMPSQKKDTNNEESNKINIHLDHNYSTPVKAVIDKSILKTPKSIVKADRDGGFLKVLSEIALVKAEADENLLKDSQKFIENPTKHELLNDDNKENNTDGDAIIPANKCKESPAKLALSPPTEKHNFESPEEDISCVTQDNSNKGDAQISAPNKHVVLNSPETTPEYNQEFDKNQLNGLLSNNVNKDPGKHENDIFEHKNVSELHGLEIIFEKLESKFIDKKDSFENFPTDNEPLTDSKQKCSKLNCTDTADNLSPSDALLSGKLQSKCEMFKIPMDNNDTDRKIQKQSILNVENAIPTDEIKRKIFKRNTMRLLEELTEEAASECSSRSPDTKVNTRFSEEARKVVELMRAVGMDDSINSCDQYFDIDKINTSFLTSDMLDAFNDTLSKPLNQLTNNDLELLLEKINSSALDVNTENDAKRGGMLEHEKENYCEANMVSKYMSTPQLSKIESDKSDFTCNSLRKSPESVSAKEGTFCFNTGNVQYTQNVKTPRKDVVGPVRKAVKTPLQPTIRNNKPWGCQSLEKSSRTQASTKIPKLAFSASKIPTGRKIQYGKPPTSAAPPSKSHKSLKFNNIESPVQAYINSKTSVLVSNVKGKSEPAFNVWMKHVENRAYTPKVDVRDNNKKPEIKSNLPFVEYKSAIPLKLEKPCESRLPRLAPKMKKLIGNNSPVIAKHEGRIQLSAPRRPQMSMNDGSVVNNANEVSVLVSRVAQTNNVNK